MSAPDRGAVDHNAPQHNPPERGMRCAGPAVPLRDIDMAHLHDQLAAQRHTVRADERPRREPRQVSSPWRLRLRDSGWSVDLSTGRRDAQ